MIRRPPRSPLFPYTTLSRFMMVSQRLRHRIFPPVTGAPVIAFLTAILCGAQIGEERRSEEHTSELQSHLNLVCRLLLEKKKTRNNTHTDDAVTHASDVRRVA